MISPQNHYILVVDDLPDNLMLIQFILESVGYQVETATSGESALIRVRHRSPSLVLLDVRMPDLDGLEVTKRLRQNQALLSMPILLLTADSEVSEEQALEVGANGILHKPLDFDELLSKIEAWCC